MTEKQGDKLIELLTVIVERTTTLSVRFETLRVLLEQHGVISASEFDAKNAELRSHWDLHVHPHASFSELAQDEYFSKIRQLLEPPADTK